MYSLAHLQRAVTFVISLLAVGALVLLSSTSAFAFKIYGSGAAAQGQLQNNVLIPNDNDTALITYTPTSSGSGFTEFGNSGTLTPSKDPTANADSSLDAFIATDSPPESSQLTEAEKASGTDEIAVPVAQTPLDVLLSLPAKVTLNSSTNIDLTSTLVGEIYAGTVPAPKSKDYSAQTWGALLEDIGLSKITTGSPTTSQFLDSGGASTAITVEARANGAGTTYTLKQYLEDVDSADWSPNPPPSIKLDGNVYPIGTAGEWPASGADIANATGNSSDAAEVLAVDENPGTIGYGTAGDAAANKTPFTSTPSTSTDGSSSSHQILYAFLQDGTSGGNPVYANPETATAGKPNVYTGTVGVNGGAGKEDWIVPGSFLTGTWYGTSASDPTIGGGFYPLILVAWDEGWESYTTSKLSGLYPLGASTTATDVSSYLTWVASTTAGQGQASIDNWGTGTNKDDYYYIELPSTIQTDAQTAAADIG
jgi:hypothetical protein